MDKEPIRWSGNRAQLGNILEELEKHFANTGRYNSLIKQGCVSASNGKLIVDSADSIPFIQGECPAAVTSNYTFRAPCPPTVRRVAVYAAFQAANPGSPAHATPTAANLRDLSSMYMVNPFTVTGEDSLRAYDSYAYT